MRRSVEREQGKGRAGEAKRNRDKVHLRESMVEAAESEGDEEGHGSVRETRMCDREKTCGDYGRECVESSVREKDSEKERHGRRMPQDTTYIRAETGYKK